MTTPEKGVFVLSTPVHAARQDNLVRTYSLTCPSPHSRSTAATLTSAIWGELLELDDGGVLYVDFCSAPVVDPRCAFASIGGLVGVLGRSFFSERHVVVINATQAAIDSLVSAVDKMGEAFMYVDHNMEVRIGGSAPGRSIDAYKALVEHGPSTTKDLAARLTEIEGATVSVPAANTRLSELYRLGFVVRSSGSSDGGRPGLVYSAYDPLLCLVVD